jgi:Mn2+/Fe2+ NRAMP family transporter
MGEYVNTMTFNIVAWVTAIAMIALTLILTYTALFQQSAPPPHS